MQRAEAKEWHQWRDPKFWELYSSCNNADGLSLIITYLDSVLEGLENTHSETSSKMAAGELGSNNSDELHMPTKKEKYKRRSQASLPKKSLASRLRCWRLCG